MFDDDRTMSSGATHSFTWVEGGIQKKVVVRSAGKKSVVEADFKFVESLSAIALPKMYPGVGVFQRTC